jgi:DNA-binding HxlR family transcriptional regulator
MVNPMKRVDAKSHCPINFALETFGDPWSLLIVRDIVYFGKKTYGEFLHSEERIATNVLASHLCDLEKRGIIAKCQCPDDRRKDDYSLTEKGLQLIPVLTTVALWGADHDTETDAPKTWIELVKADKPHIDSLIYQTVKEGRAVFVGPQSLVSELKVAF